MKKVTISILCGFAIWSCGRFANEESGQPHGQRIVCIAKQLNEIIFALGAQQDIVAVDLSSTYPPEIKELPTVGYHRALSAEGIISMRPTLVIHDNNVGPEPVMQQLTQLQIPMLTFRQTPNLDSTRLLIRELGAYFHREPQADSLIRRLDADMAEALSRAGAYAARPRVAIIHYGRATNAYLVVGDQSNAAQMVAWAGGDYCIHTERGMIPLSAETLAKADPEVIFLTDFGYDRLGASDMISELPGVALTSAARNGRLYRIEEHDLIYFGPRTGQNVQMMQKLIHQ